MMKKAAITLMGICFLYFGLVRILPIAEMHQFESFVLQEQLEKNIKAQESTFEKDQSRINSLNREQFWLKLETKRRAYWLDVWVLIMLLLGVGYLVGSFFLKLRQKKPLSRVEEMTPTEKYVEVFEYERLSMGGFRTKQDALRWFDQDQLRICEYCGGDNQAMSGSKPNQVQFCTFYKVVPEGAKDLRVVLGTVWNILPADQLQCASCGKQNQRG